MKQMSLQALWAGLVMVGSIIGTGLALQGKLDARWDQSAAVAKVAEDIAAVKVQVTTNQADLQSDIKTMSDRLAAQMYQGQVIDLNDKIQELQDKRDTGHLAPFEQSELRRYQARLQVLTKQWPLMSQSFGTHNPTSPQDSLD